MGRPPKVDGHVSVARGAEYQRRRRAANPEGVRKRERETLAAYRLTPRGRAKTMLKSMRSRLARKFPFDLDYEWFFERISRGRCEVCGLPFQYGPPESTNRIFWASVDRLKPELGYIKSNCRMVLFGVNGLKSTGTDEDMLTVARAIVEKYGT